MHRYILVYTTNYIRLLILRVGCQYEESISSSSSGLYYLSQSQVPQSAPPPLSLLLSSSSSSPHPPPPLSSGVHRDRSQPPLQPGAEGHDRGQHPSWVRGDAVNPQRPTDLDLHNPGPGPTDPGREPPRPADLDLHNPGPGPTDPAEPGREPPQDQLTWTGPRPI